MQQQLKSEYEVFKFTTSFPELFFVVVDVLQVWVTLSLWVKGHAIWRRESKSNSW